MPLKRTAALPLPSRSSYPLRIPRLQSSRRLYQLSHIHFAYRCLPFLYLHSPAQSAIQPAYFSPAARAYTHHFLFAHSSCSCSCHSPASKATHVFRVSSSSPVLTLSPPFAQRATHAHAHAHARILAVTVYPSTHPTIHHGQPSTSLSHPETRRKSHSASIPLVPTIFASPGKESRQCLSSPEYPPACPAE